MNNNKSLLWLRWTLDNGLAELLGLGATFAMIGLLIYRIDTQKISGILLAFALTVASGAIEAILLWLAPSTALSWSG